MGTQYLIDSNIVIGYLSGTSPVKGMQFMDEIVDAIPQVSVITKIETLGYNTLPAVHQILTDFMNDAIVLGLTDAVVSQTIMLRKEVRIKLPDAIIAATAIVHDAVLVSRNTSDFKNISGLTVMDPHSL